MDDNHTLQVILYERDMEIIGIIIATIFRM